MRTVVIRLHAPRRIRCIDMKRIQMSTDLLDRGEILDHSRPGLEHPAFDRSGVSGVSIVVDGEALARSQFVHLVLVCFIVFLGKKKNAVLRMSRYRYSV